MTAHRLPRPRSPVGGRKWAASAPSWADHPGKTVPRRTNTFQSWASAQSVGIPSVSTMQWHAFTANISAIIRIDHIIGAAWAPAEILRAGRHTGPRRGTLSGSRAALADIDDRPQKSNSSWSAASGCLRRCGRSSRRSAWRRAFVTRRGSSGIASSSIPNTVPAIPDVAAADGRRSAGVTRLIIGRTARRHGTREQRLPRKYRIPVPTSTSR